jgi:hypothetical protein
MPFVPFVSIRGVPLTEREKHINALLAQRPSYLLAQDTMSKKKASDERKIVK